jgi:simple sugar transport system permease protein
VKPRHASYLAFGLAVVAAYLTLPPILVRTPVPSLALAIVALGLGVQALRGGERRLGWSAVVAAVLAGLLAVVFTKSGESHLEEVFVWSALAAAMLRYATPLIFAALGGVVSERAGVVNIGLEGMILVGAFFGAWGADIGGSWIAGVVVAIVAGGLFAFVHAAFSVTLRADQIVSGMAINFLALGATGYLFIKIYGDQGTPDDLPAVPDVNLPIGAIPFLGDALKQLNLLVWVSLVLAAVTSVYLFRSAAGLRHRSVGENPRAADTAGISVSLTRYAAVTASGMLAALGGAFLSIGFVHSFSQNMSAGRGFIALAAVIFGRWKPGGALLAALLFGFSSALAQRLPAFSPSTATLFQALPYVLTLVAVAGLVGRSRPPAADGVPYERY